MFEINTKGLIINPNRIPSFTLWVFTSMITACYKNQRRAAHANVIYGLVKGKFIEIFELIWSNKIIK